MKDDNCLKLYCLLQEQKEFKDKIILKIDLKDTCNLQFNYWMMPPHIELFWGTSIEALTELVESHLLCKSLDVFTIHSIALEVLSKELNVKNIGVCVSEEIENLVKESLQRKGECKYERRKI